MSLFNSDKTEEDPDKSMPLFNSDKIGLGFLRIFAIEFIVLAIIIIALLSL